MATLDEHEKFQNQVRTLTMIITQQKGEIQRLKEKYEGGEKTPD